jgi:hypothetical protein
MKLPQPQTVREQIAWSYANLARAHAALSAGVQRYRVQHHIIRSKLYHGLLNGRMAMRSLYDDERLKMTFAQACYYCGSTEHLCVDHLIPRLRGGADEADNLIWACRACNSSKGGRDMLAWMAGKSMFPALLLRRRYLKIVARYCSAHELMDRSMSELDCADMPFDIRLLPRQFPPLTQLHLWVYPSVRCSSGQRGP